MILKRKRALITGGAIRVGQVITKALQAEGVEVVVHYQNSEDAARALSPYTVQADLSSMEACSRLVEQSGPIDILINNAACFGKESLAETTPEKMQEEFQVNLLAPMELMRTFFKQTMKGSVVNLLDRRIACHDTTCVPYSITKKGLAELTKLAALEYAPYFSVNAVAPGPVLPPEGHLKGRVRELAGKIPLDVLPSPQSVADAVLFLLKADSITGQIIFVDGGQHLLGNGI